MGAFRIERIPVANPAQPIQIAASFVGAAQGAPAAWTRLIGQAPLGCRIAAAYVTIGTTLAAGAVNYLTLRLSAGGTNVTSAMTTATVALTADTPRAFTVTTADAAIADNAVVKLTVTPATADASLDMSAVYFMVTLEYVPN